MPVTASRPIRLWYVAARSGGCRLGEVGAVKPAGASQVARHLPTSRRAAGWPGNPIWGYETIWRRTAQTRPSSLLDQHPQPAPPPRDHAHQHGGGQDSPTARNSAGHQRAWFLPGATLHLSRRLIAVPLPAHGLRSSSPTKYRLSNACVESLNAMIRLIIRRAFGFHSPEPLIALAMISLGGFRRPYTRCSAGCGFNPRLIEETLMSSRQRASTAQVARPERLPRLDCVHRAW